MSPQTWTFFHFRHVCMGFYVLHNSLGDTELKLMWNFFKKNPPVAFSCQFSFYLMKKKLLLKFLSKTIISVKFSKVVPWMPYL